MAQSIKYPCTLTIYRFVGDRAFVHHETHFPAVTSKEDMLDALKAVRTGLPPGFGASLTDARGCDIKQGSV